MRSSWRRRIRCIGRRSSPPPKAKKNVFVEKPLALTVETGQQAVKAIEDAHLTLGIGHNRRYSQVARKMKEMVESGAVGKVLHVEANYSSPGGMHYQPGMWRAKREECPGGGLAPMSLHVIDTLTWILGGVARLSGIAKRQAITKVELDDTAAALFELESGATGSLGCIFASAVNATLKFYGTKANIEARDNFKELIVTPVSPQEPMTRTRYEIDDTVQQELKAFAEACGNHTNSRCARTRRCTTSPSCRRSWNLGQRQRLGEARAAGIRRWNTPGLLKRLEEEDLGAVFSSCPGLCGDPRPEGTRGCPG